MPISANARVEAADAPGGLALVQELLNTAAGGIGGHVRSDLLDDLATAKEWAAGRFDTVLVDGIDGEGLERLRALRDDLRGAVHLHDPSAPRAAAPVAHVGLVLQPSGEVAVEPGPGADGIGGLALEAVLRAQDRGEWARLKVCALPVCGTVFYDRSRNGSARYHQTWCSNFVNLRASRARRKEA